MRLPWRPAAVLLAAGVVLVAAAQPKPRERQTLDPAGDEWVAQAADQPESEIDRARGLLARNEHRQARRLLERWVKTNLGDERYAEAEFLLGEAYFEAGHYYAAYEHYEIVIENASGELFQKALRREVDVARAFFAGQPRIVWGFLRLPAFDDGFQILDRVWERAPGTRLGEDALRLKADARYARGEFDLAQDEYAALAREFPSGRYTPLALLRAAESAANAFAGTEFDASPLDQAEERYAQVSQAFPIYAESQAVPARLEGIRRQRAEKDFSIARWYERTGQGGAAEFYYRAILTDYPDTAIAAQARSRLRGLGVRLEEPAGSRPSETPSEEETRS